MTDKPPVVIAEIQSSPEGLTATGASEDPSSLPVRSEAERAGDGDEESFHQMLQLYAKTLMRAEAAESQLTAWQDWSAEELGIDLAPIDVRGDRTHADRALRQRLSEQIAADQDRSAQDEETKSRSESQLTALRQERAWQPIETAPKGQVVILSTADGGLLLDDWDKYDIKNAPRFTHWMPLPDPPTGKGEAG